MNAFFRIPYQHPASGSVRRVVADAQDVQVQSRLTIHWKSSKTRCAQETRLQLINY
jgi:hypothetical protein